MTLLPTVRTQIRLAAELQSQTASGRWTTRLAPARRRSRGRTALIALAVGLALVGSAYADGLIRFGVPATPTQIFSKRSSGLGAVTPGTVRVLGISTRDPVGGPPWGLRVVSTTRGVGCVQVGRLEDGRLGAIGQDGAFGDDGRFHELPVSSEFGDACAALDGKGRIFTNVVLGDQPASAAWWFSVGAAGSCVPPGTGPNANPHRVAACPQEDERNVYYGLLGPYAKSITYKENGEARTIPTVGPEGAYLIVTKAPRRQIFDFPGGGTADVVPTAGPITELHYIHGATCHLTPRSWMGGRESCSPALQVPPGYTPVGHAPTAAQVKAPLRLTRVRSRFARPGNRFGPYEYLVSFKAPVAVTNGRGNYSVQWHDPGDPPSINSYGPETDEDIRAGQRVTLHVIPGPSWRAGITRGQVVFQYSMGPALGEGPETVKRVVGRFDIRVPNAAAHVTGTR